MIRCLVIDDEPLAREGLAAYLQQIDFIQLIGVCENAVEANNLLEQTKIDLIFLDIQMPRMTGLEFLRMLSPPPMVIITTAFPAYALEGYDLDVVDYLVKPITFPRFMKACKKAKQLFDLQLEADKNEKEEEFFFIKCDQKFEKIRIKDIHFIEAMQNYIRIQVGAQTYTTLLSLKSVLQELPTQQFMQVHKSYLVNLSKINAVEGHMLLINDHRIPISRSLRNDVLSKVFQDKLLKK